MPLTPPAMRTPKTAAAKPAAAKPGVAKADSPMMRQLATYEAELLHERFADFERAVLQDNIVLCDTKSGVLLAFTGAMVIFCLDQVGEPAKVSRLLGDAATWAFFLASAALLVSCGFCLATVIPRMRRDVGEDHIFWESAPFRRPVEEYVAVMRELDVHVERDEKLRHLHTLAAVCRAKFANLRHAMNFAIVGFVILLVAELTKAVVRYLG
jgi:hypothetical protein